ncbi:putative membrane protein YfkQ [Paenibacillus marchantiophytorum]|uniref:Membrane protein YfkQ n=1 Tax=Paenibacillus marchantiophytorum TaxID=1619310 RepID=A0ABQ1F9H3_9BACL|nr:spore germination protein [Paenibacillus marchantiophytorum]GGA03933.1 putative membrane protein YfkQ [Paenibacillus marchantiophytorum]
MSPVDLGIDIHAKEQELKEIFANCSDVTFRPVQIDGETVIIMIYIDGLVNTDLLDNALLKLSFEGVPQGLGDVGTSGEALMQQILAVTETKVATSLQAVVDGILNANVAILIHGESDTILAKLQGFDKRTIQEPSIEYSIRGPKESFSETLNTNTSLLRRKIRSSKLKLKSLTVGEFTKTDVLIAYIEGIAQDSIVNEVINRVERICTDGLLDTSYIEEFIEDAPYSPFPLIQNTERPDIVAASLLEGKVAILEDGTPSVLIVPMTLWSGLQTPDDYYERYMYMSFVRLLRLLMVLLSLFLPATYVAVSTFHPQLIPSNLLYSIISAREGIPFSAVGEALIMEFMFEVLREASNRLPKQIGSAVSIVGALVIGQSAVQAGIVSAPMVIIVATTGIASFTIPRYSMGFAFRLLRFPILILGSIFGLYGIVLAALLMLIHMVTLHSFGVPYLAPVTPQVFYSLKDTLIRAPRWMLRKRMPFLSGSNNTRIPAVGKTGKRSDSKDDQKN